MCGADSANDFIAFAPGIVMNVRRVWATFDQCVTVHALQQSLAKRGAGMGSGS